MSLPIRRRQAVTIPAALSESAHPLVARLYAARGVQQPSEVSYDLVNLIAPASMKGLSEGAALVVDALYAGQRILLVGDFDADGATSTALAVHALGVMGHSAVDFLVPNRFEYGYGLTPEIVELALGFNPDLIITVDNGISSLEGVRAANAAGVAVLVTDHHLPGRVLPDAAGIINPNQPDCSFPSKALAGVGVVFYLMSAVRRQLRERGWFAERGIPEPNMADYLDLVALGTVADVVPLDGNNRILVQQGLKRIRAGRARPGINALIQLANKSRTELVATDLGFFVGPRINAAGRLDDMSHGIECLLATDDDQALAYARELDTLNEERKRIEQDMRDDAVEMMRGLDLSEADLPSAVCLYDSSWHQGVVGILASRVKEQYHRPVIAFANAGNGMIKGSGRSIEGVHIRDMLDEVATANPGLVKRFGGHAMAAGLELAVADYEAFATAFANTVETALDGQSLQGEYLTDGDLGEGDLTMDTAQLLREAGPWGQRFPEPVFDGEFVVQAQRIVGEKHIKLTLTPKSGKGQVEGIWFNARTELAPTLAGKMVELVYRLDINTFRGFTNLQLLVQDLSLAQR